MDKKKLSTTLYVCLWRISIFDYKKIEFKINQIIKDKKLNY